MKQLWKKFHSAYIEYITLHNVLHVSSIFKASLEKCTNSDVLILPMPTSKLTVFNEHTGLRGQMHQHSRYNKETGRQNQPE